MKQGVDFFSTLQYNQTIRNILYQENVVLRSASTGAAYLKVEMLIGMRASFCLHLI